MDLMDLTLSYERKQCMNRLYYECEMTVSENPHTDCTDFAIFGQYLFTKQANKEELYKMCIRYPLHLPCNPLVALVLGLNMTTSQDTQRMVTCIDQSVAQGMEASCGSFMHQSSLSARAKKICHWNRYPGSIVLLPWPHSPC